MTGHDDAGSNASVSDGIGDSNRPGHPRFTAGGVWRGCIEITPVAAFVIPFGIAFGVAASAKGVAPGISVFMSVAIFAGASQFAALDLWHAPLPLATLALTVLAVNARHILLGAALAPWLLKVPMARRLAALIFMSDANFAYTVAARDRGEMDAGVLFGSGLVMWIMWIASTAAGALAGSLLGDLSRFGFDAVMVAYFTAVIAGQWKGRPVSRTRSSRDFSASTSANFGFKRDTGIRAFLVSLWFGSSLWNKRRTLANFRTATLDLLPWITAAAVAIGGTYLLPPGWHIIAGALAGGIVGVWRHG